MFFSVSCNGCKKHYDVYTSTKKPPKKKSGKGRSASSKKNSEDDKSKLRLTARLVDTNAEGRQFLICSMYPPVANTNLKQYKVAASIIDGEGKLLAAADKVKGRFQYEFLLKSASQPVSPIYFIERSFEERLKNGKSIKFKCLYKPAVGSKKDEVHQINFTIFYYDQQDKLVQKYETIACITIKDNILVEEAVKKK